MKDCVYCIKSNFDKIYKLYNYSKQINLYTINNTNICFLPKFMIGPKELSFYDLVQTDVYIDNKN